MMMDSLEVPFPRESISTLKTGIQGAKMFKINFHQLQDCTASNGLATPLRNSCTDETQWNFSRSQSKESFCTQGQRQGKMKRRYQYEKVRGTRKTANDREFYTTTSSSDSTTGYNANRVGIAIHFKPSNPNPNFAGKFFLELFCGKSARGVTYPTNLPL
eukprot:gnl/MRDRNA2_/MRDRNA2_127514_c0_seq1.p2 gnl/MRDRNA2_/MRDRNA2_127514_c0~~gnl/MRDRNA2_/MRDRNA2_127514_c0_seq1.p2  ORF type:complete len:159 (+),score=25.44 gnl/MRDRNA2_/MRDRNA2_127514_c0_seq1:707-1183(+)